MSKKSKQVHFSIIDGTDAEIRALGIALSKMKDKLPSDIEFLITNDKIEAHSVKYLLQELIKIYKKQDDDRQPKKK